METLLTRGEYYTISVFEHYKRHWSRVFYEDAKAKGYNFAFRAHRPNYMDFSASDDLQAFNNEQELYSLPAVKSWSGQETVTSITLEPYTDDGEHLLMAYMQDGKHWVIGYWIDLQLLSIAQV